MSRHKKKWNTDLSDAKYLKDQKMVLKANRSFFKPPYENLFLPTSIAAFIFGCTRQTILLLANKEMIDYIQFPVGPDLVSMEDLFKLFIPENADKDYPFR